MLYYYFSSITCYSMCYSIFTNKCIAMSFIDDGGYDNLKTAYNDGGADVISEELFEAKRDEVKDYIIENL